MTLDRRSQLIAEIKQLKQERNAVILSHLYERLEVQDIADYYGDSLGLSEQAAQTDAEVIVFCGVHFMAETAKLLSPQKTVYLANPNAGCPMADMITREQLLAFKAQHPGKPVVAYVNTSAAVKAESEFCCTSANAVDVIRQASKEFGHNEILFIPDQNLAKYVQTKVPEVKITYWEGFCPTHLRMNPDDVKKFKQQYPDAVTLVHPECEDAIKDMADFIGSTTAICAEAKKNPAKTFIVCTEDGVSRRLAADCPDKLFLVPTRASAICPNMKMTRLENIKKCLEGKVDEITIPEDIAVKARQSIDLMMRIKGTLNIRNAPKPPQPVGV